MSNFSNRQETATRSNPVGSFTGVTDSLNWFSSLVEYSSDAFISANDGGLIIGWNKAAEQLLGFSKAEMINYMITEDKAMVEGVFKGKHIGEIGGIQPTGKMVTVPLCVTYLLKDTFIQEARIYMLTDVLMKQLGAEFTTAGAPAL